MQPHANAPIGKKQYSSSDPMHHCWRSSPIFSAISPCPTHVQQQAMHISPHSCPQQHGMAQSGTFHDPVCGCLVTVIAIVYGSWTKIAVLQLSMTISIVESH